MTWNRLYVLNSPTFDDLTSSSCFINDDYFVIGSPSNPRQNLNGRVHVYNTKNSQRLYTLSSPFEGQGGNVFRFGRSVSISSNYLVIGSPGEHPFQNQSSFGRVHVYNITNGQILYSIPQPDLNYGGFGTTVVSNENYFVATSIIRNISNNPNRDAKAFIYNISDGTLLNTITVAANSNFSSCSISGNNLILGAAGVNVNGQELCGRVYIYNVTNGQLLRTIENPNAFSTSAGDEFGTSVAIDGNNCIVGAPEEDDSGGDSSGKAYIFNISTGTLIRTLNNPNQVGSSAVDRFGGQVSIFGNFAVVCATGEDRRVFPEYPELVGRSYIYDLTTGSLLQSLQNIRFAHINKSWLIGLKNNLNNTTNIFQYSDIFTTISLRSNDSISFQQIQTELGGTNPISINEYYSGGIYVRTGQKGFLGEIPSSGQISLQNFYNTEKITTRVSVTRIISQSGSNVEVDVRTIPGYAAGYSDITVIINSGVVLTGNPALRIFGFSGADSLSIQNNGTISGGISYG
jgi:hypothetical protein